MERRSARDDQRFEQRLGRLRLLVSRILAPCISIFTRADDFHAYAIRHALATRGVRCQIVETDRLALHGGMSWSTSGEVGAATICDVDGQPVAVADLDLLWWRRLTGEPRLPESLATRPPATSPPGIAGRHL